MIAYINSKLKERFEITNVSIISNIGWLSLEKVIRLGLNIFVYGWIARYLGAEQFGEYNYVLAFVTIFIPLTSLGLSGIVVRDLVKEPDNDGEILGTAFVLKLFGALISILFIVAILKLILRESQYTTTLILYYSIVLVFQASNVFDLWFQSLIKSRYVVYARSSAFIITSLAYIILILTKQDILAFVWVAIMEYGLTAAGLLIVYLGTQGTFNKWKFNLIRAGNLISQSWMLILSGFGAMLNLKIDQVMIRNMVGPTEAGIYSAAVKLSEMWYFIATFIALSVFPSLVRIKMNNPAKYNPRLQNLFSFMASFATLIAIVVTIFSGLIVNLIYGEGYEKASTILSIHIWAGIFIFMGELFSKWIINEGVLIFSPIRHFLGSIINILLNLYLIPKYGALGAAINTVFSYSASSYLVCFLHPRTRGIGRMMTLALIMPVIQIARYIRGLRLFGNKKDF